ncbi:MAG TPA: RDD family protein [Wenzhouxiangella sp.]
MPATPSPEANREPPSTPHSTATTAVKRPCSLGRRLMAMLYDGLLLIGIWMIAAVAVVVPTNQGVTPQATWFQLYLLVVAWLYFAISWKKGCTLGMKAWHIRIETTLSETTSIGWLRTMVRFMVAVASLGSLGLGFLWSLFHPKKATWHDLASNTRLVVLPKSASGQKRQRQRRDEQSGEQ